MRQIEPFLGLGFLAANVALICGCCAFRPPPCRRLFIPPPYHMLPPASPSSLYFNPLMLPYVTHTNIRLQPIKTTDKTPCLPPFHMSLSASAQPFVPSSASNVCEMLEPVLLQLVAVAGASNDGLTAYAREREVMRVSFQPLFI